MEAASTGRLSQTRWSFSGAPIAAGGQISLATTGGEIVQVNPESGRVIRTYPVGAQVRSQPVVWDGRIYASTTDGRVVCVHTSNRSFTGWYAWGANMAHTNVPEE